jgi:hypothetical protein
MQLHVNSGYQVRVIRVRDVKTSFDGTGDYPIKNDFAIYRKNFVWEKTPHLGGELKRGMFSVNPDRIQRYTDVFKKIWEQAEKPIINVCEEKDESKILYDYEEFCRGSGIKDLHTVIDRWEKQPLDDKQKRDRPKMYTRSQSTPKKEQQTPLSSKET